MILRRIRAHVEAENWFAVAIDFAIVVIGVFIGIQVANWNAESREAGVNRLYLDRIADDVETDVRRLERTLPNWSNENAEAESLERFLQGEPIAGSTLWENLAKLYFSAGWTPFLPDDTTYEELRATGRFAQIGDVALREAIGDYYTMLEETAVFYDFSPPLREAIRSKFDARTQTYLWTRCFSEDDYRQKGDGETVCPPPDWPVPMDRIAQDLRADPALVSQLRYTQSIRLTAYVTGQTDLERAAELARRIREYAP